MAATFTVNSTADAVDARPGDGICATATGACTLRAAIQETNALPGADTVIVPAGTYILTIPGRGETASATGDLDITDNLTVAGAGAANTVVEPCTPSPPTAPCGGIDRLFHVDPNAAGINVTISGMTIQNGASGPIIGGGISTNGGAILLGRAAVIGASQHIASADVVVAETFNTSPLIDNPAGPFSLARIARH
jgi:CSLREA domain-containing protein